MTDDSNNHKVSKVSRFAKEGDQPTQKADSDSVGMTPFAGQEIIVLMTELSTARNRINDLETRLERSEDGRRSDVERLLREQIELTAKVARLETELKNKDAGPGSRLE